MNSKLSISLLLFWLAGAIGTIGMDLAPFGTAHAQDPEIDHCVEKCRTLVGEMLDRLPFTEHQRGLDCRREWLKIVEDSTLLGLDQAQKDGSKA